MNYSNEKLEQHIYFIYYEDKIIGYTYTWKEADDICQKYGNLVWDSSKEYSKDLDKVEDLFKKLEQLTIASELKFN